MYWLWKKSKKNVKIMESNYKTKQVHITCNSLTSHWNCNISSTGLNLTSAQIRNNFSWENPQWQEMAKTYFLDAKCPQHWRSYKIFIHHIKCIFVPDWEEAIASQVISAKSLIKKDFKSETGNIHYQVFAIPTALNPGGFRNSVPKNVQHCQAHRQNMPSV